MKRILSVLLTVLGLVVLMLSPLSPVIAEDLSLDVNDVSFLWPVPNSEAALEKLISSDEITDSGDQLWPQNVFETIINQAEKVAIGNSSIDFGPSLREKFKQSETWKIASVRIDPCAPGSEKKFTDDFGCMPQIRLIAQPVTETAGGPKVHDLAAHLVFSFIEPGLPPFTPDTDKFKDIVNDLRSLKTDLLADGILTEGELSIHPGLQGQNPNFEDKLKAFIKKHVSEKRLFAVAFMGLDGRAEPWIFFSMSRPFGTFELSTFDSLGGKSAQMITGTTFGQRIIPTPTPDNIDDSRGVSSAMLLGPGINGRLGNPVFSDLKTPEVQDIPDIITNPQESGLPNTDCISCHSEGLLRRVDTSKAGDYRYRIPANISGVKKLFLPRSRWNVHNFGWFPSASPTAAPIPTISQRTANEAAESADFINREY